MIATSVTGIWEGMMGILFIGGFLFFVIGQCILAIGSVQRFLRRLEGAKVDNSVNATLNQMFVEGAPTNRADFRADRADYVKAKWAHSEVTQRKK